MTGTYRICTRCVMDTSVEDITFDEKGECEFCRAAESRLAREYFGAPEHRGKLDALVAQIKEEGKDRPYDCIIGVSGGVDSTYVAYLVKRELGLRPLAVHFDNGWNSDLATANIERLLSSLGIDLYTHVVDWEEFKELQLAFLRSSLPNSEIPTDHAIGALLQRAAVKNGVRFILHGGNLASESIMPRVWMQSAIDLRLLKSVHRRFGGGPLRTFPTLGLVRRAYDTFVKRIRYIGILNYVAYDKERSMQMLTSEIGWRRYEGKHFESVYTRWFQGYLLPVKYGIDKRRPHFSSLIVSGQMTREAALAELQQPVYDPALAADDVRYVQRKLGLSEAQFADILRTPPRSSDEFPNSMWMLERLAPLTGRVKAIASNRRFTG